MPAPQTMLIDPWMAVLIAGIVVGGATRLRRAGGASPLKWLALAAAGGVLAVCWVSPLETLGSHYLLLAHVIQLTLVMGVAPAFLLLALPGDSRHLLPEWLRRVGRIVCHPLISVLLLNAILLGLDDVLLLTHLPVSQHLYDAGQVAMFLAATAFWAPIVDPDHRESLSPMGRLFTILLVAIPQTFAGLTLALGGRILYQGYGAAPRLGIDALMDQRLAGLVLAIVSKGSLLVAFAVIMVGLMNGGVDEDEDDDTGGSRRLPQAAPPGRPQWLGHLEGGRLAREPSPPARRSREPVTSTR